MTTERDIATSGSVSTEPPRHGTGAPASGPASGLLVGVDIGGTFTDLIAYDTRTGAWRTRKVATSPEDPGKAVLDGLSELIGADEVGEVVLICHATTLGINAIIERRGARTALLTTEGFTDLLAMGSGQRYDVYELFPSYPEPLVPAELRLAVAERTGPSGEQLRSPDSDAVRATLERLVAAGAESLAICFLHAYVDSRHEEQVERLAAEVAPDLAVSTSSSVICEIREYPRLSTTVANAYIRPVVGRYLTALAERLSAEGYGCQLLTMLSAGGMATPSTASRFPVRILESGPAGGAVLAEAATRTLPVDDLLLFDMGGTTAKMSLVLKGAALRAPEFEVARVHRFKAGSGIPIRTPVLDLLEIGAGGGSIAHLDARGLLSVGPESSGADPGPACYGRGGTEPTVTDADLVLGYLAPDRFLGGRLRLDLDAARRVIGRLGEPLGLGVEETAWFIHSTVNAAMAGAARVHLTERGMDPSRLWLMAIGGAGPVHAERVGREVGVEAVVVPLDPGVGSAVGLVMAPRSFDTSRSAPAPLASLTWPAVQKVLADLEAEARAQVVAAGAAEEQITVERAVDVHLEGQAHELDVPIGPVDDEEGLAAVAGAFARRYLAAFGRPPLDRPLHVVTWRLRASAPSAGDVVRGRSASSARRELPAPDAIRPVYFPEASGYLDTPVRRRDALLPGDGFAGPAIVEETASSTVAGPRSRVEVLEDHSLKVTLG
ncbi:MAG: 5-oxoprolinase (ATP-hydrolyzing) [Acidimicrobiaceae bacterium]|jgi:N-methylhydantoinase A/oxoprolinase/acetone carboxylase beta subunit|nr:5-oxoprolinase (ATP-hydrolyzing) [Acidimicrobiaceae bacterium]